MPILSAKWLAISVSMSCVRPPVTPGLHLYRKIAAQPESSPRAVYLTQCWAALLGMRTHSGRTTNGAALLARLAAVPRAELADTPGPASGSPTGRLRCSTCCALFTAACAC